MTTEFSHTNKIIISTLSRIIMRETGNMHLAAAIGSWGDTLTDEEILDMLEQEEEQPTLSVNKCLS